MGELLIRGVDDAIIQALRNRALRSGRTVEAEHRALLEEALGKAPFSKEYKEAWLEEAKRLREQSPRQGTNSADLIRADRDRDNPPGR